MASIFTKIMNGELKGDIIHQDEHCVVLVDINPQGPHHYLVIPRKEITNLDSADPSDQMLLGHLLLTAAKVARDRGFASDGYRLVVNTNKHGGQTVDHIHFHVIGGRQLQWPPG